MLVAGQSVAGKDRIAARRIQLAVGLIGNLDRRQCAAGIQVKRPVGAETHDFTGRLLDLGMGRRADPLAIRAATGLCHRHRVRSLRRCDKMPCMKAGAYGDGFHSVNVFFAFRAPRRYSTARAQADPSGPKMDQNR